MIAPSPRCRIEFSKCTSRTEQGEGLTGAFLMASLFAAACVFLLSLVEPAFAPEENPNGPFSRTAFRFTGTLPSTGQWQNLLNAPSPKSYTLPALKHSATGQDAQP